jgi:porin
MMLFLSVFCSSLVLKPQGAFSQASNEELEQRIKRLETRLEMEKNGDEVDEKKALDRISIAGVVAGAYQYQSVDDAPGFSDTGRGAIAFQPEVSFAFTQQDEFFVKFGFGAGDALNDGTSPFALAPWAADLEADVKNINGRDREYLLTAWYKHTFAFGDENALGVTGGLIDATDYLDGNAYANDEYTQFMNEALVNAPNGFFPSYDIGGAIEWGVGNFSLKGVGMSIGENDDGRSYGFYGYQLGYTLRSGLGEGNYRVVVDWTSEDFNNPEGDKQEALGCVMLSFDQQLGEILGAWIRFGWADDDAAINHDNLYSGGVDISGRLWGREEDNIGIGYAYLDGGNQNIDNSYVLEAYARFLLNEFFALTADVQYVKDDMNTSDNPEGFITGLRMVVEF